MLAVDFMRVNQAKLSQTAMASDAQECHLHSICIPNWSSDKVKESVASSPITGNRCSFVCLCGIKIAHFSDL